MDGCRKEGGEGRAKAGLVMAEDSGADVDLAGRCRRIHALEAEEMKVRQMAMVVNYGDGVLLDDR